MILITMAGLSSRFAKAGFDKPKYTLPLQDRTLFDWSVSSFKNYFDTESFLFVVRSDEFAANFVDAAAKKLGIQNYSIFELAKDTQGQAETAYRALENCSSDFPITIFNIDTILHKYERPGFLDACEGYLEVFRGEGEHWSFVRAGENCDVLETREKDRISDLCSNGLYYFKSQLRFKKAFECSFINNEKIKGEFYIAPLYNTLIQEGEVVKYHLTDLRNVSFSGTPQEYEELILHGMRK